MTKSVAVLLGACVASSLGMLVLFVLSSLEMSLGAGLADVAGTLWGVTTLADLGAGLVFVAVWIAVLERSAARAAPWIIAVFLLGNFTTLIYVSVRCFRYKRLEDVLLARRGPPA